MIPKNSRMLDQRMFNIPLNHAWGSCRAWVTVDGHYVGTCKLFWCVCGCFQLGVRCLCGACSCPHDIAAMQNPLPTILSICVLPSFEMKPHTNKAVPGLQLKPVLPTSVYLRFGGFHAARGTSSRRFLGHGVADEVVPERGL